MHRLLKICNFLEQVSEIGEFELRHKFGMSKSLYAQVKSDLLNASAFKWRVEFNRVRKVWRYIGKEVEAQERRKKANERKED